MRPTAILRKIRRLREAAASRGKADMARYRNDPVGYARDVLGVEWWQKQVEIAEAILRPPHRVLVKAAHSLGKSHLAAGLVNWWYDTRRPSICITTAPTFRQVADVLWKEIRLQRKGRGGFPGPKITRLEDAPDHYAYGFTAVKGYSFQGQHGRAMLFIMDEAVGVPPQIWEAIDSMDMGDDHGVLAVCNPTDPASEFYRREQSGEWTVIHMDCLGHPNIAAELSGLPAPYPSAVRLGWLKSRLREWADLADGPDERNIEFPPGSGRWWRPGPLAEARLLGRWPSQTEGVWSDHLWSTVERTAGTWLPDDVPVIGCDVARFGEDDTAIVIRRGTALVHAEWHNGWDTSRTAGRLRQLCIEWSDRMSAEPDAPAREPRRIPVVIDDDGVGGGVVDQSTGWNWQGVNAGSRATRPDHYPNRRSELWFNAVEQAADGRLGSANLNREANARLRLEALAPTYRLDAAGRRVVEAKAETKQRIGRSPDLMDAVNLTLAARPSAKPVIGLEVARSRATWGRTT